MNAAVGSATPQPASFGRRIYGFGSVFGKTLRDSRRAILLVGGVLALLLIGVSAAIITEFSTTASRHELENVVAAVPPILQGLAGPVVNVGTLGGYLSYKYGTFFPLIASLWSILALSGTLAGEARRGSLEFVVAAPMSRRRVALEKLAGHLTAMVIAMLLVFLALLLVGRMGTLPGDEIPIQLPRPATRCGLARSRWPLAASLSPPPSSSVVARRSASPARSCSAASSSTATATPSRTSPRSPT